MKRIVVQDKKVFNLIVEYRRELKQLKKDAFISENHNAGVIDRIIEQLRDAGYTGTLSEMVDSALQPRWITVSERLPEKEKIILVFDGACNYIGWLRDDEFRTYGAGLYGITHWMPLPEPPEVE